MAKAMPSSAASRAASGFGIAAEKLVRANKRVAAMLKKRMVARVVGFGWFWCEALEEVVDEEDDDDSVLIVLQIVVVDGIFIRWSSGSARVHSAATCVVGCTSVRAEFSWRCFTCRPRALVLPMTLLARAPTSAWYTSEYT